MRKPPKTGIEIVEGLPGSGKSFYLVRLAKNVAIRQRRPVYTNLPIKHRVLRKYMAPRWGEEIAGLIRPLDPETLQNWMKRAEKRAEFIERMREQATRRREKIRRDEDSRLWMATHGPDLYIGMRPVDVWVARTFAAQLAEAHEAGEDLMQLRPPDPAGFHELTEDEQALCDLVPAECNWVEDGSMVILDEAHRIFPARSFGAEDPFVLNFLTMHRHHFLHMVFATQDRMQVSITIRRNTEKLTRAEHKFNTKLAFGFTVEDLAKVNDTLYRMTCAFYYTVWSGEDVRMGETRPGVKPLDSFIIFSLMWPNLWVFRAYASHSRAGTESQMREKLAISRQRAGLSPDGSTRLELSRMARKKRFRHVYWLLGLFRRFGTLAFVLVLGLAMGRFQAERESPSASAGPAAATEAQAEVTPGRFTSVSTGGVTVGGTRIVTGQWVGEWWNAGYIPLERSIVWYRRSSDDWWVQRLGADAPTRVASGDDAGLPRPDAQGRGSGERDSGGSSDALGSLAPGLDLGDR